jgi:hypothetical protein
MFLAGFAIRPWDGRDGLVSFAPLLFNPATLAAPPGGE